MLVSHDYKFIFIKTKKTAGSSLESYLKPYCENGIIVKKTKDKHTSAKEIKEIVGDEIWNTYTKIVPVRNPWDKTVSMYFWRSRKRPFYYYLHRWFIKWKFTPIMELHVDFEEWVKKLGPKRLNENRQIMYVDGQMDQYQFIRYENLSEDLEDVCKKLKIPFNKELLPHEKGGIRPKKDYKTFYNDETRSIVEEAYDREIEDFGYTF